ncbi:hypothetical protein [Shewanella carassii]|uniref:Flagellar protein FliT n=1 Tax=Shewanella carassii TaxID=1987584 RepID=A0ABQ1TDY4_9GAMM|nr:hypothetical protein [Shewanella carassii]BCV64785.1 hypothetical protein TUM17387_01440 [Shewanella carassii]GGE90075.1 hypothetical protein GCM10011520_33160 [Shewanella carassii]
MSESIVSRWQVLGQRLQQLAAEENWSGVRRLNQQMIQLLRQSGKPSSQAELLARQYLESCHAQVIAQLQTQKTLVQRQMRQLLEQQEGLSAYQLTQLSQPEFQPEITTKGDSY